MSDGVPRFRRTQVATAYKPKVFYEHRRGSSRERGYDHRWDQFSTSWRNRHPFCALCEQEGRDIFADVVDHMVPLVDGGDKLDRDNVWSLCHPCHSGIKAKWERYARERDLLHKLPEWCRDPSSRPRKLRT